MTIANINHGNQALIFIDERIGNNKYRGSHYSQHNRYSMEQINIILTLLNKYAPDKTLMVIRNTDISKRPENNLDESDYAQFCNEAKNESGIGTQDAMRKNIFVDLHRMKLIERYDKSKIPIDPFSKKSVKYVSISDNGLKLINQESIINRYFIYSKAINELLGGNIDILLNILRDYKINYISIYEYMFFISAIGVELDFNLSITQAVKLILEYRCLTPIQQKAVIQSLKDTLNPKNYNGSKIQKKDFHNWLNEAQQIFNLLNQTVYFIYNSKNNQLILADKHYKSTENPKIGHNFNLKRSHNEKSLYFKNHKIKRKKGAGFELHHIVPLAWSENVHHFKLLDKWKNMVYIDGFSHAKITQNNNKNVILGIENNNIILSDYLKQKVYLEYLKNILYEPKNQTIMKRYNDQLLNGVTIE